MKSRDVMATFNRGRVSQYALARTDVNRVTMSAEIQKNWMPRALGPMSIRPGMRYDGVIPGDGAYIDFIADNDDSAIIELSAGIMRIWTDGTDLVSRTGVSSAITNETFDSNITGWSTSDDSGAGTTWNTGGGNGVMRLLGSGDGFARGRQQVSVAGADEGVEHTLVVNVARGPLLLRIGTTAGDDDVFRQAVLRTGQHNIAFTPDSDFWIEFSSSLLYPVWVDSVSISTTTGVMEVATPWNNAAKCKSVRWQQSGDVIYCASKNTQQYRIERRPNNSWSVVAYEPTTGPFETENTSPVRLTPGSISGFITVTASSSLFQSGHVGAIFSITSQGQLVASDLTAESTYTNSIRVTGVTSGRIFNISITGTFVGTVSLQRSVGAVGSWVTVATYTGATSTTYDDGLDNSEVYYRLGVEAGNYTSGTVEARLTYDVGSITGVVRVTNYTSPTEVSAIVLEALGGNTATDVWAEGSWSDVLGWPQAVVIGDDGRLWWSGNRRNWGSVPDSFDTFDPEIDGDSGPINRGVGTGASSTTNWMLPLSHIITGTGKAEYSIRSTSFDEPVTPSNYSAKSPSNKGSYPAPAVKNDDRGYFIGRSPEDLYELSSDAQGIRYSARDLTLLCPEIGDGGFERIAIQVEPDTRLHAVRADGTVAILVVDDVEDVLCWVDLETDGEIEDVVVLPGDEEDRVWYRVKRVIDGVTVRYHEKLAKLRNCVGGELNRLADSYATGSGAVTGLDHLEGETVVIWGDSADQGTGVVSGGAVDGHSYDVWVAGLGYTATYKSAKLAGQTQMGLSLTQRARVNSLGLILANTYASGLEFGPDFDVMDNMPNVEDGAAVEESYVWSQYDQGMTVFPGDWDTDTRICLRATAPKPCTVLAAVFNVDRQDNE